MTESEILGWLRGKLAEAEKELVARRQMESTWRGGTDQTWKAVGCKKNQAERLRESAMQGRIATKCQRDVEMCKAAIEALNKALEKGRK